MTNKQKAKSILLITIYIITIATTATIVRAQGYWIPERTEDNVVVASYNIQWLGQSEHNLNKLAKVIERFDVCGILEVKKESEVLELVDALKQETNKDWGYVYGIRTYRPSVRKPTIKKRYYEAYAAVWRRHLFCKHKNFHNR